MLSTGYMEPIWTDNSE